MQRSCLEMHTEKITFATSEGHRLEGMLNLIIAIVSFALGVILSHFVKCADHKRRKHIYKFMPHIELASGNHVKIERFGKYAVRQLGLKESEAVAPHLTELAEAYIRGDKSGSDDSAEDIRNLLSNCHINGADIASLIDEMLAELDACMYSYFAFHWNHGLVMMKQVLWNSEIKKIRKVFCKLTRERRLKKATRFLTTKYVFITLVDRFKAMGHSHTFNSDEKRVLLPAGRGTRCPVLLFIGGGMGAGKSTVVKEILKCPFWSMAAENAVKVEADSFKEIAQREGHGLVENHLEEADRLLHKLSTDAASSLLVTALNEGRDVIFDGTMSWEPFVLQTIAMARDIHKRHYRMGPGYKELGNGKIEEKYWEPLEVADTQKGDETIRQDGRPYRIELVGVICDAHLAVARGMRRAILTKRGVPIKGQLQSHKWFAESLEKYCKLVDTAKIFSTSKIGQPPELIAWKGGNSKLLKDCEAFQLVKGLKSLNPSATSVGELYEDPKDGELLNQTFREVVLDPHRESRQGRLLVALRTISLDSDILIRSTSSISASSDDSVMSRQSSAASLYSSSEDSSFPNSLTENCSSLSSGQL